MPSDPVQPEEPGSARDPRLEIPETLRRPVDLPESMKRREEGSSIAGAAKAWGIALNFIATILAGAAAGWLRFWDGRFAA